MADMTGAMPRTGVWFVGGRGSVATTAVVGAYAVSHGLAPATGLVTEKPDLLPDGLPPLAGLVFGGHDVTSQSLPKRAEALAAGGVFPAALVAAAARHLEAVDAEVLPAHVAGEDGAADAVRRSTIRRA